MEKEEIVTAEMARGMTAESAKKQFDQTLRCIYADVRRAADFQYRFTYLAEKDIKFPGIKARLRADGYKVIFDKEDGEYILKW